MKYPLPKSAVPEQEEASRSRPKSPYAPVRGRAWLIGLLLIPLLIFWLEYTEIVAGGPDLAAMSLPMAVVFALLVLIAANLLVKRFSSRLSLSQAELMLVYTMNTTAIGIGGIGMMQFLTPALGGWYQGASPENRWANWQYLVPRWAVPNPSVIPAYFQGKSSFFTPTNLAGWAEPMAVWTGFIFTLLFCFYCIAVLVRRQWVESERLIFPIVQIPLEISQNGGDAPLWRSKALWLGIAVPAVLESLAALHFTLFPTLPYVPIKPEASLLLNSSLSAPPWNAIGYTTLSFYPLVIGLTYLLSLDVSFSCWFFYLFTKIEYVAAAALGYRAAGAPPMLANMPYTAEQGVGAWIGLAVFSVYLARPYLAASWRKAFRNDLSLSDSEEPLSYRAAYLGLFGSAAALVAFGTALGLSWMLSLLFFGLFFLFALTFTRIRAEAGLPWGQGPNGLSHGTLLNFGGTEGLTTPNLMGFAMLRWADSDWRCLGMPTELEAMKIAASVRDLPIHPRLLTLAVMVAVLVGSLSAFGSCLGIYYHYGALSAQVSGWRTSQAYAPFNELQNLLIHPQRFDQTRMGAAVVGFVAVSVLSSLRLHYVWWPLHPIGYAVANTETMTWIWFSMLIGWLCKSLILRYGGVQFYRQALPFFLGLLLGDYVISCLWALFFLATGLHGYRTFPI